MTFISHSIRKNEGKNPIRFAFIIKIDIPPSARIESDPFSIRRNRIDSQIVSANEKIRADDVSGLRKNARLPQTTPHPSAPHDSRNI
ncbi:hypothetical protein GWI33_017546 [Rhynchophorus ferrugineus]|uniref:Uncharacterized protein n=1 Tax=Rhynchophorus ferrugineus TaxID=354439 RepID=A0A834I957_RHYFE|nr:hypothetical protein GWI33_017546 [Rhynchophorus ferrugineus]